MKNIVYLLAVSLVACSAGSNAPQTSPTTPPGPPNGSTAYLVFSQSHIRMQLGSTAEIIGNVEDATRIFDPFPLYTSESGIVTLTPNECATFDYDKGTVHGCPISITAIGVGTTVITGQMSGPPLIVTVVDGNDY